MQEYKGLSQSPIESLDEDQSKRRLIVNTLSKALTAFFVILKEAINIDNLVKEQYNMFRYFVVIGWYLAAFDNSIIKLVLILLFDLFWSKIFSILWYTYYLKLEFDPTNTPPSCFSNAVLQRRQKREEVQFDCLLRDEINYQIQFIIFFTRHFIQYLDLFSQRSKSNLHESAAICSVLTFLLALYQLINIFYLRKDNFLLIDSKKKFKSLILNSLESQKKLKRVKYLFIDCQLNPKKTFQVLLTNFNQQDIYLVNRYQNTFSYRTRYSKSLFEITLSKDFKMNILQQLNRQILREIYAIKFQCRKNMYDRKEYSRKTASYLPFLIKGEYPILIKGIIPDAVRYNYEEFYSRLFLDLVKQAIFNHLVLKKIQATFNISHKQILYDLYEDYLDHSEIDTEKLDLLSDYNQNLFTIAYEGELV